MKRWLKIFFGIRPIICYSLLITIPLAAAIDDEKTTISFSYDNSLPPYAWEENNKMKGIFIDIIDEIITKQLNLEVSHKIYPWATTINLAKAGRIDGFIRSCNIKDSWADSSPEIALNASQHIFAYINSPKLDSLKTLKNMGNFSYGDTLYQWEALRPYTWVSGNAEKPFQIMDKHDFKVEFVGQDVLMKFLALGRADATIMAKQTGLYKIRQHNVSDKIVMLPTVISQEYCIFINNQSRFQVLLPDITKALKMLKSTNTINRIKEKYLAVESKVIHSDNSEE